MVALHSLCREGNITEVKVTVSHVRSLNSQLSRNPNVKVDLYNGDEQRVHLMKLFHVFSSPLSVSKASFRPLQ